jgi:hypothetical protein
MTTLFIRALHIPMVRDGVPFSVGNETTTIIPVFTDNARLVRALRDGIIEANAICVVDDIATYVADLPNGVSLAIDPTRDADGVVRIGPGIDNKTLVNRVPDRGPASLKN